jgi:hypothetical protein
VDAAEIASAYEPVFATIAERIRSSIVEGQDPSAERVLRAVCVPLRWAIALAATGAIPIANLRVLADMTENRIAAIAEVIPVPLEVSDQALGIVREAIALADLAENGKQS